ncbi:hypothetical protein BS78_05G093800 [Paspalum vaginatum]|nr:hypothetical protein BS78_05G093800 [Paspalum vaginatum]
MVAPEAVRTSVLARRWRHLWKFASGLRLGCLDDSKEPTVKAHREFVDHLLLLRGGSPLDTCEFVFGDFDNGDELRVNLWVRHAILCKVRALRLDLAFSHNQLMLDDLPLVSQHLTSLYLSFVELNNKALLAATAYSKKKCLNGVEVDECTIKSARTDSYDHHFIPQ